MWDKEVDVVVVGCGGAGASAAITAHDLGAQVVLLEKDKRGGGNTRLAGGTIREYVDIQKAAKFFNAIFTDVSPEMSEAFVEEGSKNADWMRELGADLERAEAGRFPPAPHVIWPHLEGADGVGGRWRVNGDSSVGGVNLWAVLERNVEKRNIETLFHTGAEKLVTNDQKEVIGLIADGPNGEIRIRARRAVVLTCGGFQYNREMQRNFLGIDFLAQGCLGNTGDGIKMSQELGADLWHMTAASCGIGYKFPEFDMPMGLGIRSPAYIYVDQDGKRFLDEAGVDVHAMAFDFSYFDHKSLRYPRIPSYVILDETTFRAGRLIGWCPGAIMDYYQWSPDNSTEIEKGWIKTAPTIRDLASEIGLKPDVLQETISKYNISCIGGYDPEFGRRQETLSSISTPPFYAIEIIPCLLNTQGGPKRNHKAQVLHVNGEPIKRLYSAGELGSVFNVLYPGAGNISECLAFGRIAGRNAAKEEPINS
jgi:succinate dehydrogenase/fumarate reductase flavoprotein subunit